MAAPTADLHREYDEPPGPQGSRARLPPASRALRSLPYWPDADRPRRAVRFRGGREAISASTPVKNCNGTPHRSGAERHPGHRRARCHGGGQALLPPDDRTQRTAPRLTAALEIHRPAMPVSIVTATATPAPLSTSGAAAQERRPDHAGEAKATVAENGAKNDCSTRRTKRRARCHRRTAVKRRPVMATKGTSE